MTDASPEQHERFLAGLERSEESVWLIARWLQSRGNHVKVNAASKADKPENWKSYSDHGDLEISQRIEVKQLTYDFTSAADWPFGREFIVCAKHSYDRSIPKPYAYIHVNPKGTHAAITLGQTAKHWTVKSVNDTRFDRIQDCYLCPLEHIQWITL